MLAEELQLAGLVGGEQLPTVRPPPVHPENRIRT
jgi:hypothetical protein